VEVVASRVPEGDLGATIVALFACGIARLEDP